MRFLFFFLFITSAFAQCDNLYPNNTKIVVPNMIELCNKKYVAVFDTKLHGNLFSSEHFIYTDKHAPRLNDFHADIRLSGIDKAKPSDYVKSGYDKGHMAPAADMITADEMSESFLMSNMTPQSPHLNKHPWQMLETKVRNIVAGSPSRSAYIITGAIYNNPKYLVNTPIPSSYYKCVWISTIEPQCWTAENLDTADVINIKYKELRKIVLYLK